LVLVGGGRGASEIERKANEINERAGRRCVVLTGPTLDPRAAYAAADIVLGQGGSSLRGMAYAKPVIVIGQEGYSEVVAPGSIDRFQRVGFHGIGLDGGAVPDPARMHALASGPPPLNEDDPGIERLAALMRTLLEDPIKRQKVGAFGRDVICSRFSLEQAAKKMEALYESVLSRSTARRVALTEGGSTMSWVLSATLKAQMVKGARRVIGGR
jgi:phosphatidylinositol alpha-mannosyltransferase